MNPSSSTFKFPKKRSLEQLKPYKPGKPAEELQRELGLKKIYKLASNENLFGVSKKALKRGKKELKKVNFYPEGKAPKLRKTLSEILNVPEERLIFGNGTNELLHLVVETFCSPGDEVVYPFPSFVVYKIAPKLIPVEEKQVPLREDFSYDLEALIEAVSPKTKVIFLANPNNPTGKMVPYEELTQFLRKLRKKTENYEEPPVVVLDEAYYEFASVDPTYPQSLHPDFVEEFINQMPIVITRSLSKVYALAGIRIGYAVAHEALIEQMEKIRQPFNVNRLAQVMAEAALMDETFIERTVKKTVESKKFLYRALEEIGISYIRSWTNFVLIKVGEKNEDLDVFDRLLKKGLIVRPGSGLGFPGYIRVTVAPIPVMKKFVSALQEVLENRH